MKNKLVLLVAASAFSMTGIAADYTNIVLINLNDVDYGNFSFNEAYGYTTPNIDKMAAEGVRFTHFLVGRPTSGASRTGLLTGCCPNHTGFSDAPRSDSNYGVHPEEITIVEVLKQKGYSTAIFGKWHLGSQKGFLPLQNGFDEYYGLPYSNDVWLFHLQQGEIFNFPDLLTYDGNETIGYNTDQTRLTTDYTTRSVNFTKKNKNKPFFLYLAHNMPHVPLAVSDKFKGKSEQSLYGDVMMEIDWSVGEIFKASRELGLEDNTLMISTPDNDPWTNYGNHAGSADGLRKAKATTFDGGNRVPCIVYWKGKTLPDTTHNKLAFNTDFLPTFAEITQAPLPPRKTDGVSILPLIESKKDAGPRESFVYYCRKNDLEAVTDGMFKLVFPHKYITYGAYEPGNGGQPSKLTSLEIMKPEMYDLRRDPGGCYSVITRYPKEAAKLVKIVDQERHELGDDLARMKGTERREPDLVQGKKRHDL